MIVYNMADLFFVEAATASHALQFSVDLGLNEIVFEGDALGIIKAPNSDEETLSPIGCIIDEANIFRNIILFCNFT